MATTREPGEACVCCGKDTLKVNRRLLNAGDLLRVWKELFKQKCDELNVEINAVLHRGSSLYVCRTCFSALESNLQKKKTLLQNMENAIEFEKTINLFP